MSLEDQLAQGIAAIGLNVERHVQMAMLDYINLLAKWNRAYNLTAVRDPKQMVTRHLLDSLSIVPYVKGDYVLDIGSGAGLPGIPLALCLPDYDFTLLDSNGKKTRFMTQAVRDLKLDNVSVVKSRIEFYQPEIKFDSLVSRAYSSIAHLAQEAHHLCKDTGCILAMKGTYPLAEMDELADAKSSVEVVRLDVPGVNGERHLAIVHCQNFVLNTAAKVAPNH